MTTSEAEELRAALAQLPRTQRGRRYPRELRERVLAYVASSGQTLWAASEALGIPDGTLSRWHKSKPQRKTKLRRVRVDVPVVTPSALTFTTRDGHQLTGLDVSMAAELIRRLSS